MNILPVIKENIEQFIKNDSYKKFCGIEQIQGDKFIDLKN